MCFLAFSHQYLHNVTDRLMTLAVKVALNPNTTTSAVLGWGSEWSCRAQGHFHEKSRGSSAAQLRAKYITLSHSGPHISVLHPLPDMPILGSPIQQQIKIGCQKYGQIGIQLSDPVEKHCGKRRNCSLPAISPFPSFFFKRYVYLICLF